jgi:hypothetical protein
MYSISWKLYRRLQMKGWFRCSSIRRSLIIFRTLSDRITVAAGVSRVGRLGGGEEPTLILADIFQGEGQASIFPLDNAHLPKGALSNDSQQTKVVEVSWRCHG